MTEPTQAKPIPRLFASWRDRVVLAVALLTGCTLTLLAANSMQQTEALLLKQRKTAATQAIVSAFDLELTRTTEAIRNAGLMLESSPQLTRDQFNHYMQ